MIEAICELACRGSILMEDFRKEPTTSLFPGGVGDCPANPILHFSVEERVVEVVRL
jgi:hypothetical protein